MLTFERLQRKTPYEEAFSNLYNKTLVGLIDELNFVRREKTELAIENTILRKELATAQYEIKQLQGRIRWVNVGE